MMTMKVPVTMRSVLERINRKLAPREEVLKKAHGRQAIAQFGAYYVLDWRRNIIEQWHVDPVALAQDLDVLKPWEVVKEEA